MNRKTLTDLALVLATSVVSLFALTGCSTVSTTTKREDGVPKYAPSNPAQIQILRAEPTRANVRLGEIRVEPTKENVEDSKIDEALRQAAAKLGADAAVVLSDRVEVKGSFVVGGPMSRAVQQMQGRVITAAAIKYQ